jgi:hypothetical protein
MGTLGVPWGGPEYPRGTPGEPRATPGYRGVPRPCPQSKRGNVLNAFWRYGYEFRWHQEHTGFYSGWGHRNSQPYCQNAFGTMPPNHHQHSHHPAPDGPTRFAAPIPPHPALRKACVLTKCRGSLGVVAACRMQLHPTLTIGSHHMNVVQLFATYWAPAAPGNL